jgi:hypothetical protein
MSLTDITSGIAALNDFLVRGVQTLALAAKIDGGGQTIIKEVVAISGMVASGGTDIPSALAVFGGIATMIANVEKAKTQLAEAQAPEPPYAGVSMMPPAAT